MKSKRVTIADVARAAGVSPSAVSVTHSGRKSSTQVSAETRRRILEVSNQMQYTPSLAGKSLRDGRSYLIGLLCREMMSETLPDLLRGIQAEVRDIDYSLVVYLHEDSPEDEVQYAKRGLQREVDGLIVMPALTMSGESNAKLFKRIKNSGVPVIQLYYKVLPEIPAVYLAHYQSGRLGARHLIDLGHKRIIHYTYEDYLDQIQPGVHPDARARWDGFRDEMNEAGLEPIAVSYPIGKGNRFHHDQAYSLAAEVLNHPSKPTAIFAYNMDVAFAVLQKCQEMGIRVPDDLSLLGVSDVDFLQNTWWTITALACSHQRAGRLATRLLHSMINGSEPIEDIEIPYELVLKQTTSSPRS